MSGHWTLPLLQDRLDELSPGTVFALPKLEMENLFGLNSAAVGRIKGFATSHRCTIPFNNAGVTFCKT